MAITHIQISNGLAPAVRLRNAILGIKTNLDALADEVATMATEVNGDTAVAANYGEVVTRYGVEGSDPTAALANAKLLFDEANTLKQLLSGNGSVSGVNGAILQAANKVR